MIDKQTIEERKKTITNDILTVKERLSEYEKKKVEENSRDMLWYVCKAGGL